MTAKPPLTRIAQAVALLAGALVLVAVIHPDDARFFWTPLVLGLAYLAAAAAGGRHGGHWATACVLTGWGAAVGLVGATRPELETSGLYLAGAGLGALAGLVLARAGFAVDPMGLAGTIAVAGLILALSTRSPEPARRRPHVRRGARGGRPGQLRARRARPARRPPRARASTRAQDLTRRVVLHDPEVGAVRLSETQVRARRTGLAVAGSQEG